MNPKLTLLSLVSLTALAACGSNDITAYAGKQPTITVQQFYGKPVAGYGLFQDSNGAVKDRYYATLVPHWNGPDGVIDEKQWNEKNELFFEQTWHIHVADDGKHFTGTASRIDGPIAGEVEGNAMHMTYVLVAARENGKTIHLDADDWTYLQPNAHGLNRVAMSKFGFHVGDVTYDLHPMGRGDPVSGYFPSAKK